MLARLSIFIRPALVRATRSRGLELVPSSPLLNIQTEYDSAPGDTELHQVVRHKDRLKLIQDLLSRTSTTEFEKMAKTVNDIGELPVDVVKSALHFERDRDEMYSLLAPFMGSPDVPPLSTPIDVNSILSRYSSLPAGVIQTIQIACEVANKTRSLIPDSHTHPQTNELPKKAVVDLERRVATMRTNLKRKGISSILEVGMEAERLGIGNCEEIACSVVTRVMSLPKQPLNAQLYTALNGDHVVVGLGKDSIEIYCDAWSGKIFLAHELNQFTDYRFFNRAPLPYNVLVEFNPNYHRALVPYVPDQPPEEEKKSVANPVVKTQSMSLRLFDHMCEQVRACLHGGPHSEMQNYLDDMSRGMSLK